MIILPFSSPLFFCTGLLEAPKPSLNMYEITNRKNSEVFIRLVDDCTGIIITARSFFFK